MSQAAKAQEPSMEEILASIRRIIADDDGRGAKGAAAAKPAPAPAPQPPPAPPPAPPKAVVNTQDDVDAMLADLEQPKAPPPPPAPPPVAAKPEPPPPPPRPEAVADVLVLTEEMAAPPPQQPAGFRTIEGSSDVVFSEPARGRAAIDDAPPPYDENAGERLLSNATAMAVDNAFNSLAHTILGNNARTLEDLVKDMLRPMLKAWLDDNLPGLVDRIVRSEIERVSRGR